MNMSGQSENSEEPQVISRRKALYVPPAVAAIALAQSQGFHGSGPTNLRRGNGKGLQKGRTKTKTNKKNA